MYDETKTDLLVEPEALWEPRGYYSVFNLKVSFLHMQAQAWELWTCSANAMSTNSLIPDARAAIFRKPGTPLGSPPPPAPPPSGRLVPCEFRVGFRLTGNEPSWGRETVSCLAALKTRKDERVRINLVWALHSGLSHNHMCFCALPLPLWRGEKAAMKRH